ncbi:transposase, partial [Hominenteromicrobium sp.]
DMYPLYWIPSRGGIIMRYTYEYKRKCVELYREGKWPETPEGVSDKSFRDKVRLWVRAEDSRGPEALKHKNFNRNWTPEERLELVSQVMSGKSCVSVAIEAGIQDRLLYQWVQNYKTKGYNGLVEMKKGRPSKGVPQMKKEEARPLNESEREELIRLRAENEYIKAENEVIKKELALREERHAAQLKARKQRSSKSCVKKDTN